MNGSPRLVQHLPFSKLQRNPGVSSSPALLTKKLESHTSLTNSPCRCPRIMVVDDNPFNTMAFETILGSLNIKCDFVYSGSTCIKNLLNRQSKVCGVHCKQYAVVFMDQEKPEMSGSEIVRKIRRLQKENLLPASIKVIGCTAHKSKEEVEKFMEAGIKQCIHKPISAIVIKDILKEIALDA